MNRTGQSCGNPRVNAMLLTTAFRTVCEVGFNLTIGALADRRRTRFFNSAVQGFRKSYAVESSIAAADLADLFPGVAEVSVTLDRFPPRYGNVQLGELVCLASICAWLRPQLVLEIGTFDGNTTLQLALNSPPGCRVHTLALPPGRPAPAGALTARELELFDDVPVGERFRNHPAGAKITQHLANSREFDFSPFEGRVDLIFVDGSHEHGYVAADTAQALRCCSPRGVILWHDYTPYWPGVVRAVSELPKELGVCRLAATSLAVCRPRGARPNRAAMPPATP
jgi:predicted O-methyltransferase YrrM